MELENKIVLKSLTEYRTYIMGELALYDADPDENWIHPDDVEHHRKMVVYLEEVIRDYRC
jgi:hypothetical protein